MAESERPWDEELDFDYRYQTGVRSRDDEELPDEKLHHYEAPDGSVMFQHDVLEGMHDAYEQADVVWTEPAWRPGYESFKRKAGKPPMDVIPDEWKNYVLMNELLIEELEVPGYMVVGPHFLNYLSPDDLIKVYWEFHDNEPRIAMWNGAEYPDDVTTLLELLKFVCHTYDCVADYNCGLGTTARIAHAMDTNFVASDINAYSIRAIAEDLYDYTG